MYYSSKNYFETFKMILLLFTIFSSVLFLYNILFPHEVFAMSPPRDFIEDYYGNKEYMGKDSYGYYNQVLKPKQNYNISNLDNNTTVQKDYFHNGNNPYTYTKNPDYNLSSNFTKQGLQCKPVYHELEANSFHKLSCRPEHKELHFWTTGENISGGTRPVVYELESKEACFELNAEFMDGSSISTGVDFNTWFRRQKNALEFVKNFDWSVPKQPTILDRVCLGIKTVNNKVVFIYLKMHDMSRRKVVWNVWEKNRDKYQSYKHFKKHWNKNTGIWSHIEKDIRDDIDTYVEDLLGLKNIKKTMKKSVKVEIERLLREKQPFRS